MKKVSVKIAGLRREYSLQNLDEGSVDPDPLKQFQKWLDEAIKAELKDAHAMTLATATGDGKPSARVVLLRGCDENGLVFFTNYDSEKGQEIHENPYASLNFYWAELERQVRVEGKVAKIPAKASDEYFAARPRGAQISAWVSPQSEIAKSRSELEKRFCEIEKKFKGKKIPRPDYWGGYSVMPVKYEFWQGRENRLHDRIVYELQQWSKWRIVRLAP